MNINHYVVTTVDCDLEVHHFGFTDAKQAVEAYVEEAQRGLAGTPNDQGSHLALVRLEIFMYGALHTKMDTKDALECAHNRRGDVQTTAAANRSG